MAELGDVGGRSERFSLDETDLVRQVRTREQSIIAGAGLGGGQGWPAAYDWLSAQSAAEQFQFVKSIFVK